MLLPLSPPGCNDRPEVFFMVAIGPMAATVVEDLRPRAQAALSNSPFYELRELQVEQRQDGLLISGRVSSFYHKQLAQEVVRSVASDARVINSIRVEPEEYAD